MGDLHIFEILKKNEMIFSASESLYVMEAAAYGGHVDLIRLLKRDFGMELGCFGMEAAASKGNLEVVKMVMEESPEQWKTILGSEALAFAIFYGHDQIIEWILTTEFTPLYFPIRCATSMETLKMLRGRGFKWNELTMAHWAGLGRLDFIKYAHEEGCQWDVSVSDAALQHKQHETYAWLRDNGCPCRSSFMSRLFNW